MGFLAHGSAAVGLIGDAVIFLVRNFTDSFLKLGLGPTRPAGQRRHHQLSPGLFDHISHLPIAVSGFIAATGLAGLLLAAYGSRGRAGAWSGRSPPRSWAGGASPPPPNHFHTWATWD